MFKEVIRLKEWPAVCPAFSIKTTNMSVKCFYDCKSVYNRNLTLSVLAGKTA